MYNMLFGVNPAFPVLLSSLNLGYHTEKWDIEGEYPVGRFRDIYLSKEGDKLVLYTRNGGGNRNCWEEEGCPNFDEKTGKYYANGKLIDLGEINKPENHDRSCLVYVNWKLTQHPMYITDYDDEFDCTYAYFEFRVPDQLQEALDKLMDMQGGPQKNVSEKFDDLISEMKAMTSEQVRSDPRFSEMSKIIDKIGKNLK